MRDESINLTDLASAYRRLVLWFGAQFVFVVAGPLATVIARDSWPGIAISFGCVLGILVTLAAVAYYAFRTATALGSRDAALWALAMLVPIVNAIMLLVLSSRAADACRAHGLRVGLFGPRVDASNHATFVEGAGGAMASTGPIAKVHVNLAGQITLDGSPVDLQASSVAMGVIDAVIEARLPISLSSQPDFSTVVGPGGSVRSRVGTDDGDD